MAYMSKHSGANIIQSPLPGYCHANELDIAVLLTFEQKTIMSSSCSACHSELWCPHVIATVLYRIRNAEKVRIVSFFMFVICYTVTRV